MENDLLRESLKLKLEQGLYSEDDDINLEVLESYRQLCLIDHPEVSDAINILKS